MKIFLDMDGVLVNFCRGVEQLFGREAPLGVYDLHTAWGYTLNDFWRKIDSKPNFWLDLEPMHDMLEIITGLEQLGQPIAILTSPAYGGADQKLAWVRKHLPKYSRRILIGACKEMCASPDALLIDDYGVNCDKFAAAGGYAVLVPRPWNDFKCHMPGYVVREAADHVATFKERVTP